MNRQLGHTHILVTMDFPLMTLVGRLAQRLGVDLITMGTVGRGGITGLLLGNAAEKVLRTFDCSILTVKAENFVSPINPASWPLPPGPGSNVQ